MPSPGAVTTRTVCLRLEGAPDASWGMGAWAALGGNAAMSAALSGSTLSITPSQLGQAIIGAAAAASIPYEDGQALQRWKAVYR